MLLCSDPETDIVEEREDDLRWWGVQASSPHVERGDTGFEELSLSVERGGAGCVCGVWNS